MNHRSALEMQNAGVRSWPPPPHDPRERDFAMRIGEWHVLLFGERKFQYFVSRGLWHLQLWHADARVSVLTPSRLTGGLYEVFPIANWKGHAANVDQLCALMSKRNHPPLPPKQALRRLENALVNDVTRAGANEAS